MEPFERNPSGRTDGRTYVHPHGFRSNGSIVFSDFWCQGSFLWYLEDYKAGFSIKNYLAKNGKKGVKNVLFLAFLGNQTIDFSDVWHVK